MAVVQESDPRAGLIEVTSVGDCVIRAGQLANPWLGYVDRCLPHDAGKLLSNIIAVVFCDTRE